MLVDRAFLDVVRGFEYPLTVEEFKQKIEDLGGGGSINSMKIAVNCAANRYDIPFRIRVDPHSNTVCIKS